MKMKCKKICVIEKQRKGMVFCNNLHGCWGYVPDTTVKPKLGSEEYNTRIRNYRKWRESMDLSMENIPEEMI